MARAESLRVRMPAAARPVGRWARGTPALRFSPRTPVHGTSSSGAAVEQLGGRAREVLTGYSGVRSA